jgi:3',5'-cyclic AMP phosphodiesterase CpdA
VQLSDAHVGFNGPPDPLGTKAFEGAVEMINGLPKAPDLVLFTGDLTHDTEEKDVHAQRMKQFQEICSRMKVGKVMYVPGEYDASLDGGQLYREFFKRLTTRSITGACTLSRSTTFRGQSRKWVQNSSRG